MERGPRWLAKKLKFVLQKKETLLVRAEENEVISERCHTPCLLNDPHPPS